MIIYHRVCLCDLDSLKYCSCVSFCLGAAVGSGTLLDIDGVGIKDQGCCGRFFL